MALNTGLSISKSIISDTSSPDGQTQKFMEISLVKFPFQSHSAIHTLPSVSKVTFTNQCSYEVHVWSILVTSMSINPELMFYSTIPDDSRLGTLEILTVRQDKVKE